LSARVSEFFDLRHQLQLEVFASVRGEGGQETYAPDRCKHRAACVSQQIAVKVVWESVRGERFSSTNTPSGFDPNIEKAVQAWLRHLAFALYRVRVAANRSGVGVWLAREGIKPR
jgi:hypothetical protein